MRGEVLHYDEAQGFGFITGADGNRYTFRREDLRRSFPLSRGVAVEFRQSGDQARDVSLPLSPQVSVTAAEASRVSAPATTTPIATPTARPMPQHFGRNATNTLVGEEPTSLWDYFRAGITTNYANFRGRARRKEYWGFVLFYLLALIILSLAGFAVDFALGNMVAGAEFPIVMVGLSALVVLASLVPGIAISVRRFHDIGLSGWFYLVMFVVGFLLAGSVMILAIVLGLIPSQKRENKWGPVPVGVTVPSP